MSEKDFVTYKVFLEETNKIMKEMRKDAHDRTEKISSLLLRIEDSSKQEIKELRQEIRMLRKEMYEKMAKKWVEKVIVWVIVFVFTAVWTALLSLIIIWN